MNLEKLYKILESKARVSEKRYDSECEKEIFVKRTFHKWFSGKYFVWAKVEKTEDYDFGSSYSNSEKRTKRYIYINAVTYSLDWHLSNITIYYSSASNPTSPFSLEKLSFNEVKGMLENGYLIVSSREEFQGVQKLFKYEEPEREYSLDIYSMDNLKKTPKTITIKCRNKKYLEKIVREKYPKYIIAARSVELVK